MKAGEFAHFLADRLNPGAISFGDGLTYLLTQYADDYEIERRNAASIVHIFMRDELAIKDEERPEEIKKASKLCDLYDCRVCVAGITQVYVRNIMDAGYWLESGRVMFGGRDVFEQDEAELIVSRIQKMFLA